MKNTDDNSVLPIGTIVPYAVPLVNAPEGWLPCDGSDIPGMFEELILLLGSNKTPQLAGLTFIGTGQAQSGHAYAIGQTGGEETHKLTTDEMPSHSHEISYVIDCSGTGCSEEDTMFCPNQPASTGPNTSSQGGDSPHNNMQPYYVVNYLIYGGQSN